MLYEWSYRHHDASCHVLPHHLPQESHIPPVVIDTTTCGHNNEELLLGNHVDELLHLR